MVGMLRSRRMSLWRSRKSTMASKGRLKQYCATVTIIWKNIRNGQKSAAVNESKNVEMIVSSSTKNMGIPGAMNVSAKNTIKNAFHPWGYSAFTSSVLTLFFFLFPPPPLPLPSPLLLLLSFLSFFFFPPSSSSSQSLPTQSLSLLSSLLAAEILPFLPPPLLLLPIFLLPFFFFFFFAVFFSSLADAGFVLASIPRRLSVRP